jgi:hypothetical protein
MKSNSLAPVLLFAYNRLDTLRRAVSALQQNQLAKESELFVFSDAAKTDRHRPAVAEVRKYLKTINGFKNVRISEAEKNKGLADSIIGGVSSVINEYGKAIVLEDDLLTSPNFLLYMNKCLSYYQGNPKIFSISGFSFPIDGLNDREIYFSQRSSSWGWATWSDRWKDIDWNVSSYETFRKDPRQRKLFNRMGTDMAGMLDKQMRGEIDSWAIRWNYHLFLQQLYSVHPAISKVQNIGFVEDATNTRDVAYRYATKLDTAANKDFLLTENIQIDPRIIKQYTKHFSITNRIKYKIINTCFKVFK